MPRLTRLFLFLFGAMQIAGCQVPDTIKPSLVVVPGPEKAPSVFAEDDAACAAQANQQISAARDAANAKIATDTALAPLGVSKHEGRYKRAREAGDIVFGTIGAAMDSEQTEYFKLRRLVNFVYAQCLAAKGYPVTGFSLPNPRAVHSPGSASTLLEVTRSRLLGSWVGPSYVCGRTENGIELLVTGLDENGAISATVRLFRLPRTGNEAFGEFAMVGEYDIIRQKMYLEPVEWIKRPPNYIMLSLQVSTTSADNNEMQAIFIASGCEIFSVRRTAS